MRLIPFALVTLLALVTGTGAALAIDADPALAFLPIKREAPPPDGAVGLCDSYAWACAPGHAGSVGADDLKLATRVNVEANAAIPSLTDRAQYGVIEHWALPTAQGGDCEDYAIYKKRALIEAGISPDRLLLTTVLDRENRAHAVLLLRTDMGDFVLDNLRDRVLPWYRTGYVFLRMQNPERPKGWVSVFMVAQGRS